MKRSGLQIFKFIYFAGCFWYLFTIPAQAYIDPSAVTYIIQAVAGALIAIGAVFTIFRHRIFAFFRKNKSNADTEGTAIEFKEVDD